MLISKKRIAAVLVVIQTYTIGAMANLDCTKPDVIHQVRDFMTCQSSLALGSCGALGGYAAGRLSLQEYQKRALENKGPHGLNEPKIKALSRKDEMILKKWEEIREKINSLERSQRLKNVLTKFQPVDFKKGDKEDFMKFLANSKDEDHIRIKRALEELDSFSKQVGGRTNELIVRGTSIGDKVFTNLKALGNNIYGDEKNTLLLLKPDQLAALPKGTVVYAIDGDSATVGFRNLGKESFKGYTFWGVKRAPVEGQILGKVTKAAIANSTESLMMKFLPNAAGRAGLLLGGVAGAGLYIAGEAVGSNSTACANVGDDKIHLNSECQPVYEVNPTVMEFLNQDDGKILKDFQNQKICQYYAKLRDKLLEQPKFSDITCNSASQISMKMQSQGVPFNGTILLSEGKVSKINLINGQSLEQINIGLIPSTEELAKASSNRGPFIDFQKGNTLNSSTVAKLATQSKLYVPEIVKHCQSNGTGDWKSAFIKDQLKTRAEIAAGKID